MSADVDPAIALIVAGLRTRFFTAIAEGLDDAAEAMRADGYDEHVIACAAVSATATAYVVTLIENVPLAEREATHADVLRNIRGHMDCAVVVETADGVMPDDDGDEAGFGNGADAGAAWALPAGVTVQ